MNEVADSDTPDRASPIYSFKLRDAQADFSAFVRFVAGKYPIDPTLLSPFSLDGSVESRTFTHALFVKLSDFVDGRIDFGELGVKTSSAQITTHYRKEDLQQRLVIAVVNFPPRQIADFFSEVLTLGVIQAEGDVVLVGPDRDVPLGLRIA